MGMKLSRRQQEILDFVRLCIDSDGLPPTRAEITHHFGFASPNAAQCHLKALAAKGAIRLNPGTARGIVPLDEPRRHSRTAITLPVIGRVAAGQPVLAIAHRESEVAVEPGLFQPVPHYLLRVQGDSMIDAGICNGDLLAVHRTPEARDGQIIVARLDDEVTVKRLRRKGRRLWLEAANQDFSDIVLDGHSNFQIEGLGVGVIRRLESSGP